MTATDSPYQGDLAAQRYWSARNKLTAAARALNEKLMSSDIPEETASALASLLQEQTDMLGALPQITGILDMGRLEHRGSIDNVMGELVAMAGRSNPCAPQLEWIEESNKVSGKVIFGQAFEGPPGHTHGGWVAGILDHIMGMTHIRTGHPGMTGGLSVRYVKPTPLNTVIHISAEASELDDRRTEVRAHMHYGDITTATAEAIFVRIDSAKFRFGL
ncbi:MAG: PaaI family thioesterase [Luminiphilus sp.]|nr:PaaI family thioesterase [Luminiphilus sp.]